MAVNLAQTNSQLPFVITFLRTLFPCSGEAKVALAKIDPLQIQKMSIKQGGNNPVNLDLEFSNVELHGLKDFRCTSVK